MVDQPATALIEALTINVPSVFYWDHEIYLMRPDAERYFRLLQEAGILFTDPASAANKVKEIFDNPAGWWFRDDVQKARLEFCKQFCYARKDWANIWAKELRGLIDISGKTEKEQPTWIS